MRTSILVWSTFSGVVLGIFVDAVLIGLTLLLGAVIPNVTERITQRWAAVAAVASVVVLTVIPAALAVLGFLEGRLKAT